MSKTTVARQPGGKVERRREQRKYEFSEPMAELKFPDTPTYQLKLREVSAGGAGIIVRPDSKILTRMAVGQELKLRLLSTSRSNSLSGVYAAVVEHVSELKEGPYKGHFVVGVALRKIT
jgi:hypothetical protein